MEPTGMFFGAHLFGWLLVLLLGIGIGRFMMRRRFARMMAGGSGPLARGGGGCCGPRHRRHNIETGTASDSPPAATAIAPSSPSKDVS